MTGHAGEVVLVTGFPQFHAKKLVDYLLEREPAAELQTLVPAEDLEAAHAYAAELTRDAAQRLAILEGDARSIDFGLSGAEYRALVRRVDRVYHFQKPVDSDASAELAEATHIGGAREILEFERASKRLRGLVVLSSAVVSGSRSGLVLEDELNCGQSFRTPVEESLARAELMFASRPEAPIAILRPTQIVGDSRSGEIDRFDWPYPLIVFVLSGPDAMNLPLPGADVPIQVVPIDFVVRAAHCIGTQAKTPAKRYHLVEPNPPSVRRFCELVAERVGKRIAPHFNAALFTRSLLGNPGTRLLSRSPRALFDMLGSKVSYDAQNANEVLSKSAVEWPRLEDYLGVLVDQVASRFASGDREGNAREA